MGVRTVNTRLHSYNVRILMNYKERCEYKLTRKEHAVAFYVGGTAEDFQRALAKVPAGAKLIDVEDDDRRQDGSATLVFLEEAKYG